MLRAITSIYIERQSIARKDIFKVFRVCSYSSASSGDQTVLSHHNSIRNPNGEQTRPPPAGAAGGIGVAGGAAPPPPPPPGSPRAWSALAALAITASLGGVYYYRKQNHISEDTITATDESNANAKVGEGDEREEAASPDSAEALPTHVQYLLVGGGTASFAAMRAIRSARPDAQVLIVAAEPALPYMRPPLSKELWRERDLARQAMRPDALAFRQWNGRRRPVLYEPAAFYTPPERLRDAAPGAGVARGWRVVGLDPARHAAELAAGPGGAGARHTLTYDKALVATGARPRRVAALRAAAAAGRSLTLRGVRDAARLAAALDDPATRTVAVVGGGFLATELAAALAERLREEGKRVVQVFREEAPLTRVLPAYLAAEAARRLTAAGVELRARREVTGGALRGGRVALALAAPGARGASGEGEGGEELEAEVVVECVGCEPAAELARAAGLEVHEALGGVVVNAELQARSDVFAAGDVACFHDPALGRRRVEHHDHAVVTGRLAGENMAAVAPPKAYTHQSMFWSDLGPQLGYEAIGIIDSRLPTVGVFSADAVGDEAAAVGAGAGEGAAGAAAAAGAGAGEGAAGAAAAAGAGAGEGAAGAAAAAGAGAGEGAAGAAAAAGAGAGEGAAGAAAAAGAGAGEGAAGAAAAAGAGAGEGAAGAAAAAGAGAGEGAAGAAAAGAAAGDAREAPRRFERGVVFYLREQRVVGVLLWNLFNRMHVARQVLAHGEFEDLFEVAKLFSPHDED